MVNLNIFRRKHRANPMKLNLFLLSNLLCAVVLSQTQDPVPGPIITEYGAVWDIPQATYRTDTSATYKAVFDVMNSPEDKTQVNPWIETAARFLNMHARAGVAPEQLQVALIVHNKASTDLLNNTQYKERFGTDNPNAPLIKALMESGAEVVFCGQSSMARKVPAEQVLDGVKLSLSAMTALIQFQNQGYQLIKF